MQPLVGTARVLILSSMLAAAAIHTGPEVGAKMPNFEAQGQDGKQHRLADLLGPKGLVLVVFRSADW